jgi:hypothetical protein
MYPGDPALGKRKSFVAKDLDEALRFLLRRVIAVCRSLYLAFGRSIGKKEACRGNV